MRTTPRLAASLPLTLVLAGLLTATAGAQVFTDDFERGDAPVDGWVSFRGDWNIAAGQLTTGPTGAEHWLWAGDPVIELPERAEISFDIEFLAPGTNPGVGRHGGVMFCSTATTERFAGDSSGYVVWWIDRASDFGLSLARFDGAAFTFLKEGTFDAVAQPPSNWTVQVNGPSIKVLGDGVEYISVVDETYRGGHLALWTWAGGQEVAFDNVSVSVLDTGIAIACIEPPAPPVFAGVPVEFDGSCSQSIGGGELVRHTWDFGGGTIVEGVTASHTFDAGGPASVTLTVEDEAGNVDDETLAVSVAVPVVNYSDDFARADGPVTEWTANSGEWRIAGEAIATGPTAGEQWVWAGSPPVYAPRKAVFEFDFDFLAPGTVPAIGRHAGFQFHCNRPSARSGGGAFSGYFIDWIDRASDRGVRLTRVDNGAFVGLGTGQGVDALPDPPTSYRVEVDGDSIRVFGDDVLYVDVVDATYRGGHFGYWTWQGGQEIAADNLVVTGDPLSPCFEIAPATPVAGEALTVDATCSEVFAGLGEITGYSWDFGDGTSVDDAPAVVEHTYEVPDVYTVTLTVTDDRGETASVASTVTATTVVDPFADCFETPGPVTGWTSPLGVWDVTATGRLTTTTATGAPDAEAWAYPGEPAGIVRGDVTIEFDTPLVAFNGPPLDVVGKHFGLYLFGNTTTTNRFAADSSGYTFWWIDRASDFGVNFARWDGPALTVLQVGSGDLFAEPPSEWRIEVEGDMIRIFGDGVLAIEVEDGTYREGHVGLWVWKNMTLEVDDFFISPAVPVPGSCDLDLSVSLTDDSPPLIALEGTTSPPEFCGAADTCECEQVEVLVDGVVIATLDSPGGVLSATIPLPESCEAETERELVVRCIGEAGPGVETSATFICPTLGGTQLPGDCNQDAKLDISDASCIFNVLFTGEAPGVFPCGDGSADDPANRELLVVNGEVQGPVNLSQGIYLLTFLFNSGEPPRNSPAEGSCLTIPGCPEAPCVDE